MSPGEEQTGRGRAARPAREAPAPCRQADLIPLLQALASRAKARPPAPARPARTAGGAPLEADQRAALEDLLAVVAEQNRVAQDRLLQAEVMLNRVERMALAGEPRPAAAPSRPRRLLRMVLDLNVTLGVLLICSFWLGPLAALRLVGYGM